MSVLKLENTSENRLIFTLALQWYDGNNAEFKRILRYLSDNDDWSDIEKNPKWRTIFVTNMNSFTKAQTLYDKLNEFIEEFLDSAENEGAMVKVGATATHIYNTLKYFADIEHLSAVHIGVKDNTLVVAS